MADLRTVLLVDDDEMILAALARALSDRYRMIAALSAAAAWPHVIAGVDVLVCDLRLRGESGLELLLRLPHAPKIPRVIAISGLARPTETFSAAAAGALRFLEKPFAADALADAIEAVCMESPALEPIVAAQLGARSLADVEGSVRRTLIEQALASCDGNQSAAAQLLGLTRQRVSQILKGK